MSDENDPRREAIDALLQEQGIHNHDRPAVLVGWVLVCDWMDDEGERWLTQSHAASIPRWHANGMTHELLYGSWPEGADE